MLFYIEIFRYFFNPNSLFVQDIKVFAENVMKQNINSNIFLNISQTDYALACMNQAFMQIGMENIMNQVRNILMIFNINNLRKKSKSLNIDNNTNDSDNDDNLHHNLEMNLLSLPSF